MARDVNKGGVGVHVWPRSNGRKIVGCYGDVIRNDSQQRLLTQRCNVGTML